jgi:hypothetical protein
LKSNFIYLLLAALATTGLITTCKSMELQPALSSNLEGNSNPISTDQPPFENQLISDSEQTIAWQNWMSGPHSSTYDLGKGPNTYCARCHSPMNWDPSSRIDEPPNCVTCKFDFESAPRIALSNPLVPEMDWKNISCGICHSNLDDTFRISWFNNTTGTHETVTSTTELCEKCHRDTETILHKRDLGKDIHSAFVCTDCHDSHSTTASCSNAKCHVEVLLNSPFILGHDAAHDGVICVSCHDSSGLEVGPIEDGSVWVPFRTTELLGNLIRKPYQSHDLQREVNCDRCHYTKNPWGLDDL